MENSILENLEYLKSIKSIEYLEWAAIQFELSLSNATPEVEEFFDRGVHFYESECCIQGSDIQKQLTAENLNLNDVEFELAINYSRGPSSLFMVLNQRIPNPAFPEYIRLLREKSERGEKLYKRLYFLERQLLTIIEKRRKNETT